MNTTTMTMIDTRGFPEDIKDMDDDDDNNNNNDGKDDHNYSTTTSTSRTPTMMMTTITKMKTIANVVQSQTFFMPDTGSKM